MESNERQSGSPLDETDALMLAAVARGKTTSEVAAMCGASPRTVRRRLAEIRDEWGCRNNIALVVKAVRDGTI